MRRAFLAALAAALVSSVVLAAAAPAFANAPSTSSKPGAGTHGPKNKHGN